MLGVRDLVKVWPGMPAAHAERGRSRQLHRCDSGISESASTWGEALEAWSGVSESRGERRFGRS